MATTTLVLLILLILSVITNILLAIRVVVLRNYLHLFEAKIGEIELRLSPKHIQKELKNEQEQKTVRT
jgi:hypothetical protein